jgi:hypothetical protein
VQDDRDGLHACRPAEEPVGAELTEHLDLEPGLLARLAACGLFGGLAGLHAAATGLPFPGRLVLPRTPAQEKDVTVALDDEADDDGDGQ